MSSSCYFALLNFLLLQDLLSLCFVTGRASLGLSWLLCGDTGGGGRLALIVTAEAEALNFVRRPLIVSF